MSVATVHTQVQGSTCFIRLARPEARNAINAQMLAELQQALDAHQACTVVVLEGGEDDFCFGADLGAVAHHGEAAVDPEQLYALWQRLAFGPQVSVAHVRGQANAGGVGFVAACDLVVAGPRASFSLSELLFDLLPACVMPFLVQRVGVQRANRMALGTLAVGADEALRWGLVDVLEEQSEAALRRQLIRLRRLSPKAIAAHKRFMADADTVVSGLRDQAIAANRAVFADPRTRSAIARYVETGLLPWEQGVAGPGQADVV
ncbi:MAG: enoyl-CoA hydratase/isomerase [Polaromonas sp.]|nr:enoyl-CoA hydratase/isomerase [Polaromonas sp.]